MKFTPHGVVRRLLDEWNVSRIRHPRITLAISTGFVLVSAAVLGSGCWLLAGLTNGLPGEQALRRIGDMDQATTIFDRGDRFAFSIYKEQRIERPLAEISPHLVQAIVAIEDQRFFDHHGFDLIRILSAALTNLRTASIAQGGSTITQQLARQSFLTLDKTYRRKLQEVVLAARIERLYSKQQILELYLNKVYFGDGLYGAETAARGYFGKRAADLTVPDAALLAGLVKSPSNYAPSVSLARAMNRRNVVLQAMLESGAIDRATWQTSRSAPVILNDTLRADEPYGRYFKEQVRRELVERFGLERVYQGGLRVYSTLDTAMQQDAERAVARNLQAVEARRQARRAEATTDPPLQGALIAIEPVSGDVRAMVGGRDFGESRFNRAVQARRQPGSAFKPFVYAAALESGYTPATLIDHLDEPVATPEGAWTPEDEHSGTSAMSLRAALRTSSNRAAVRLLQDVGIPRAVHYAKAMGVGDVPSVPSLALGSGEVTLESITAAYAAFANRGYVPRTRLIRRVEDRDGHLLYQASVASTRAISEQTAFLMSSMLADVINAGTAYRARSLGFLLPAAGKTGTTNDFHDAWFIGFTPSLVTGVWVGFDQPKTILPNGFAADIAVPVWAEFMKAATKGDRPQWLRPPAGITSATVCRLSGLLATSGCEHVDVMTNDGRIEQRSMAYTEYFVRGTEPVEECSLHRPRGVFATIASIFGAGTSPAPPPAVTDVVVATQPEVRLPGAPSDTEHEAAPPAPRKRGFWSRIFGAGRDRSEKDR